MQTTKIHTHIPMDVAENNDLAALPPFVILFLTGLYSDGPPPQHWSACHFSRLWVSPQEPKFKMLLPIKDIGVNNSLLSEILLLFTEWQTHTQWMDHLGSVGGQNSGFKSSKGFTVTADIMEPVHFLFCLDLFSFDNCWTIGNILTTLYPLLK